MRPKWGRGFLRITAFGASAGSNPLRWEMCREHDQAREQDSIHIVTAMSGISILRHRARVTCSVPRRSERTRWRKFFHPGSLSNGPQARTVTLCRPLRGGNCTCSREKNVRLSKFRMPTTEFFLARPASARRCTPSPEVGREFLLLEIYSMRRHIFCALGEETAILEPFENVWGLRVDVEVDS